MIYANYLLEFLKAVLVWPVAIFAIFIIFRENISKLIDEISELGWKDGKIKRKEGQPSIEEIEKVSPSSSDDSKDAEWNYKNLFLDTFLKPNTLSALQWFRSNPSRHTREVFHRIFQIPTATGRDEISEKDSILTALDNTKLIDIKNNSYSITEEGKTYLNYRGL